MAYSAFFVISIKEPPLAGKKRTIITSLLKLYTRGYPDVNRSQSWILAVQDPAPYNGIVRINIAIWTHFC